MTAVCVQSVTSSGATLTLNGVGAGNLLVLFDSYFFNGASHAAESTPTDSNGTFQTGSNDAGATGPNSGITMGAAISYVPGCNAGTHVATPDSSVGGRNATLAEFSGLTSSPKDVATSAVTGDSAHTSQSTGTTSATAQADELVCIAFSLGAPTGSSDVGFTDPVTGFTTLRKVSNDSTDVATFHAYRVIAAVGAQSATFNWTDNEVNQDSHACICTFKITAAGIVLPDNQIIRARTVQKRRPWGLKTSAWW